MNKKVKLILLGILGFIIATVAGLAIYFNVLMNKIDKVEATPEELGISQETDDKLSKYDTYKDIINIAVFGVDAGEGEAGRSDSIMVLSIDPVHNKVKLFSIMRDSYVDIPGYGMDKINHAFAYGNSTLALRTINENFDLNIDKFVATNFSSLPKIVDSLGGVDIEITQEELEFINSYIGNKSTHIVAPGIQRLDGEQALAYSRIRYTSGGDYKRTERQRTVIEALFGKLKTISITDLPGLLNEFLPLVQTNMGTSEMLSLGSTVLKIDANNLVQDRFPRDGFCQGETINSVYYTSFDKEATIEQIHKFIYED